MFKWAPEYKIDLNDINEPIVLLSDTNSQTQSLVATCVENELPDLLPVNHRNVSAPVRLPVLHISSLMCCRNCAKEVW